ncbi:uncharacterized protein PFLUO_LOCUS3738 [Penicillium psychrofluorescens]|uniref:uncharacterized protein n=1 Tax=Penicillium psychrofluorescens TaxID=3158075 RepID=UPI003CCDB372
MCARWGVSERESQRHHISKAYGDMSLDWTEQLRSLENLLTTRLQALERCYPAPTEVYDPLLLFANILGQATVIYFCKVMKGSTGESADLFQWSSELYNYHRHALEASGAIIRLATTLRELPFSKLRVQELFHILRDLKNINNHQQSYLDLLPQSCVSKTSELFGLNVEDSIPNAI